MSKIKVPVINRFAGSGRSSRPAPSRKGANVEINLYIDYFAGYEGKPVYNAVPIDVLLKNKMADKAISYLYKGCPVYIEGVLKLKSWTLKDGTVRKKIYVDATKFDILQYQEHKQEPNELYIDETPF